MDLSGRLARAGLPSALLALAAACERGQASHAASLHSIAFEDVTKAAGIANSGRSFGMAAGDLDGDGFDDLFFGNHYHGETSPRRLALFRNGGGRGFEEVAARTFRGETHGDLHGAEWADFDGDGDQDLTVLTGAEFGHGACQKLLYVNDAATHTLVERASEYGLDDRESRGRTPLWLPSPQPGGLDVLFTALKRADGRAPTTLFRRQESGRFEPAPLGPEALPVDDCLFAALADLDGNGRVEVVLHGWDGPRVREIGAAAASRDAGRFELPKVWDMSDCAVADFDGDLLQDLLVVCSREMASADLITPQRLDVAFVVQRGAQSVSFACDAPGLHVVASDAGTMVPVLRVGAAGTRPAADTFDVRREDGSAATASSGATKNERRLCVGFDAATSRWTVFAASEDWWGPTVSLTASAAIRDVAREGFTNGEGNRAPALLLHESRRKLSDRAKGRGLTAALAARSVVAGDFDDDGDVDLFVVASSRTVNLPDLLYANRGDGSFDPVPDAGGAAGSGGGYGDAAVALDYDRDGFLDLLVVNGEGSGVESASGRTELFRNRGNSNHWLEIDLVGTVSNRDGIGACVTLTAGGRAQVREQGGAMHRFAQGSKRLHFGLGAATAAERIAVRWPSGIEQTLEKVAADQVLAIREPPR